MIDGAVVAAGLADVPPGPRLAALLDEVDLSLVPNHALVEVVRAERRQLAHHQGRLFAALAEMGRCTAVDDTEQVARSTVPVPESIHEIGTALHWTSNTAFAEHDIAETLRTRLPAVQAALLAGEIDRPKARVFVDYTRDITDAQIARLCTTLLPLAPTLTTGQLVARLRRMLIALDPEAMTRRYRRALRERRVWGYLGPDGTASLGASGLSPEEAAASSERVWDLARTIRAGGHPSSLMTIRADLFVALLDGTLVGLTNAQIVQAMLARGASQGADGDGGEASGTGSDSTSSAEPGPVVSGFGGAGSADADPVGTAVGQARPRVAARPSAPNHPAPVQQVPEQRGSEQPGRAQPGPEQPGPEQPRLEQPDLEQPGPEPSVAAPPEVTENVPDAAERASGRRTGIEIRIRLSTLLGLDDHPAEIPGWGPVPSTVARETVGRQHLGRWRFAITDHAGHLLLAGATRHRPVTRATAEQNAGGTVELQVPLDVLGRLAAEPPPGVRQLIADLVVQWAHREELRAALRSQPGARFPHAALRRHIEVRDRNCVFPGCRRPAMACQQDHTDEVRHGGVTVAENLGPLCVFHHGLKTGGVWQLVQPVPGWFRWTGPSGHRYRTRGEPITPALPDPLPGPTEPDETPTRFATDPDQPPDFGRAPPGSASDERPEPATGTESDPKAVDDEPPF